jgi:hypothetical protein
MAALAPQRGQTGSMQAEIEEPFEPVMPMAG